MVYKFVSELKISGCCVLYLWLHFIDFSTTSTHSLKGWPTPFILNESYFHQPMVKRLNSNGVMEKTDKSKILSGVYDFVTTLVLYPSPSQYNEIAMAILKKWPLTAQGLSMENAKVRYIYK